MLNPTAKVDLQQKQITSLMKQLNEYEVKLQHLVNENNLLNKDKQELLKVNKEWDKQHRLLNHEKKRIEAEFRMRYGGVEEAMPLQRKSPNFTVDEDLKKTIVDLSTNNESLMIEISQLKEECKKRDSVCFSAKKLLQEERSAKEALMQTKLVGDEKVNELQTQLEREKQRNAILKQEVERLVNVYPTENNSSLPSLNVTEQIEMLKQQISVYADDFASERADRERIQADRENQRNQIIDLTRENNLLQDQLHLYHNDFEKERREKERLQKLLKEHGRASQAWLHQGNIPHRYSPQEVQELAFQQQQPLHARGQAVRGHPDRLCRGCEADRDVIDGPAT
ncbi:TNFAIP3-interacting protein 3-like isoform X2 [Xenia sp. Carnegie-2017]|uniref:TNFAIP3-interacting protein 3-like isoform X2 n=1 Tax=Xenia sp. Carnegie-2017 TaxID=2897299 RepID=UPI001F03DD27|nr:TNFAIP3-interacting protein 3-like isoform X2 [Xenia sp. Carnegie-2017]